MPRANEKHHARNQHNEEDGIGAKGDSNAKIRMKGDDDVKAYNDSGKDPGLNAGEHPRVAARFDAMRPLLERRAGQVLEVWAEGSSFLAQAFTLVYLGDWVSYWLALLNEQDPTTIDDIMALKKRLSET